jgi:hypothetical protein
MANIILTNGSRLFCPHSGIVRHYYTGRIYQIGGELPMRIKDHYTIEGCDKCWLIQWVGPFSTLFVDGSPILNSSSMGFCIGASGQTVGNVQIGSFSTTEFEPENVTCVEGL